MWLGHEKHCTRNTQGQKVKGQGHKIMRRSSTKTANISRKRHSVVEMHLSYRTSRSPERTGGQIFDRKFINNRFCACAVKICSKLAYSCCQIATILVILYEIVVAEHDGEGSF